MNPGRHEYGISNLWIKIISIYHTELLTNAVYYNIIILRHGVAASPPTKKRGIKGITERLVSKQYSQNVR
jgi:hypothetical protein